MSSKKKEKIYEIGFHLIPSLDEDTVVKEFDQVHKFVQSLGEVITMQEPQLIELAYTIRHKVRGEDGTYPRFVEAFFCSVKCAIQTDAVQSIKDLLQESENVLRFIIVETVREDTRVPENKIENETGDDTEGKKNNNNKE